MPSPSASVVVLVMLVAVVVNTVVTLAVSVVVVAMVVCGSGGGSHSGGDCRRQQRVSELSLCRLPSPRGQNPDRGLFPTVRNSTQSAKASPQATAMSGIPEPHSINFARPEALGPAP